MVPNDIQSSEWKEELFHALRFEINIPSESPEAPEECSWQSLAKLHNFSMNKSPLASTHRHSQEVQLAQLLQELPGHVAARVIESVQLRLLLVAAPVLLGGSQGQGNGPNGVVGLRGVLRDGLREESAAAAASSSPTSSPLTMQIRLRCTDPGAQARAQS